MGSAASVTRKPGGYAPAPTFGSLNVVTGGAGAVRALAEDALVVADGAHRFGLPSISTAEILAMLDWFEVRWVAATAMTTGWSCLVAAAAVVASVIHDQPVWNGAEGEFVDDTMCLQHSGASTASIDLPVASKHGVRVDASGPGPAVIRSTYVDLFPKSLAQRSHDATLAGSEGRCN